VKLTAVRVGETIDKEVPLRKAKIAALGEEALRAECWRLTMKVRRLKQSLRTVNESRFGGTLKRRDEPVKSCA
jgi:hypothetical protein